MCNSWRGTPRLVGLRYRFQSVWVLDWFLSVGSMLILSSSILSSLWLLAVEMTVLAGLPVLGFLFVLRVRVLDAEVAGMSLAEAMVAVGVGQVVLLVQSLL